MSLVYDLVSSVVRQGDAFAFYDLGLKPEFFKPSEQYLYTYVDEHVRKYGAIPAEATVNEFLAGYEQSLPEAPEPPMYYRDQLVERYLTDSLKKIVTESKQVLMDEGPIVALGHMVTESSGLTLNTHSGKIVDFRQALDPIKTAMVEKKKGGTYSGILTGWTTLDKMSGGLVPGDTLTYVGRPGMGKALPVDAKVLTLGGWKLNRDLKVGDRLESIDGKPSVVTGVFPQGVRQAYKVTFSDGRVARCDGDHLWEASSSRFKGAKILTTLQIADKLSTNRYHRRLSIPLFGGKLQSSEVPYSSPYVIGLFLGEGCTVSQDFRLSTGDPELLERALQRLPAGHAFTPCGGVDYSLTYQGKHSPFKRWFREQGLCVTSDKKFLPSEVFHWPKADRVSLLQGLMDTDGWVEQFGAVRFASSSKELAKGVQELVWSLGGKASLTEKPNACKGAWEVVMTRSKEWFTLGRKRSLVRGKSNPLTIVSVVEDGEDEMQCISVSHPRQLYITEGYIVTHNTWMLLHSAHNVWRDQHKRVLFISMEMNTLAIQQRLAAMHLRYNLTKLKNAEMSTKAYKSMITELTLIKDYEEPLWIVDGNLMSTVQDITVLCRQLKPHKIYIDGAYLVKAKGISNKWERIAYVAETVKSDIAVMAPATSTYQFGDEAVKRKKKGEEFTLEDIYGGSVMGQVSSLALGLMQEESVETIKRRKITIMKGRNGEIGDFHINWGFQFMDFSEWKEDSLSDLQFV